MVSLTFIGCANPYAKNCRVYLHVPPITSEPTVHERQLTGNVDYDKQVLESDFTDEGPWIIGMSQHIGTGAKMSALKSHAGSIGADLVFLYRWYVDTTTGAFPLVFSDGGKTTVTRRSGSTSGDFNFQYNETERTQHPPKYSTHWIPYSKHNYGYHAVFATENKALVQASMRNRY